MEKEPKQRTNMSLVEQGESLGLCDVFTAQERADNQLFFMDSFGYNSSSGQYEPVLGENQHQLGPFPDSARYTFKLGRELIYVSYHSPEETKFRFGDKIVRPDKGFLAISYVGPVVKDNSFVERFVIRADCLTEAQAQNVIYELRSYEGAEGWYKGKGVTSFSKDFDPFGQEVFLAQAIKKVVGEENLNSKHKELIKAIEDQANARLKTHSVEKNQHEINPIFLRDAGKYVIFDSVLNRYVLWEETTSDLNSLTYIYEAQRLTSMYLKDPNPNKIPLVINFAVALSARTAGFRKDPSAAASRLEVDKNGIAKQITDIKNLSDVDPGFFLGPVSNWEPEMPDNPAPVLPILPQIPYPVYPITPGGGITGFYGDIIRNTSPQIGISNATTEDNSATVMAMAFVAPGIVDVGLFMAPSVVQAATLADPTVVTVSREIITDYQNEPIIESTAQADLLNDRNAESDIVIAPPTNDNWFDFPTEPLPNGDGGDGGGGLMLPLEIKATIWDERMIERLENAQKATTVFEDKVLPANITNDRVVFDASQVSEEVDKQKEVVFRQYASDLEVVQVEKTTDVVFIEQENLPPLLLADIKEELIEPTIEVNKKYLEIESVYGKAEEQTETHRDAAQYHSERNLPNGEVVSEKTKSATKLEEPKPHKTDINTHRQDGKKRVSAAAFNNLFLSYIRQRQILREFLKQNISIPDSPDVNELNIKDTPKERKSAKEDNNSFLKRVEQNKTQPKRVKVRAKITNTAFLALLLLTKLKLLTKVKLLARKNSLANLTQLFVTDTLLLFLVNPKLFLVKNYFWQNKDKTVKMN